MDPALVLHDAEVARNSIINEVIASSNTPVQEFFEGAVVLVTGGSGFLGKQLIEKLVRSCKINKIYLLLRPKQEKCSYERIKELLQDQLYEYLHNTQPDFASKLIPVEGDITKIRLGMSEENWKTVTQEVDIIFHGAATINFSEHLTVATLTNVRGTREMITLAKSCKKLKSFVHISTAFVHATPDRVEQPIFEQFYDCPLSPNFLIDLVQEMDPNRIEAITDKLINGWPNTYSFTKALSEEIVRTSAEDLPVCIVRPAIVMPAYREPPGWADKITMNGPVGFIAGACLGGLHVMYANSKTVLDMVPVDIANNAAIVAAHETAARRQRGDTDIRIYTVTGSRIPVHISTVHEFLETKARRLITPKLVWYGYVVLTGSKFLFLLLTWLLHFIPGYLADLALKASGKKPKAIRLFNKAYKMNKVYAFYMSNYWKFEDTNLVQLYENLSPEDRTIYNCNTAEVDVDRYMHICCFGVRKYILLDGLQDTDKAVRKASYLRVVNAIFLTVYGYVLWKIMYLIYSCLYFTVRCLRF